MRKKKFYDLKPVVFFVMFAFLLSSCAMKPNVKPEQIVPPSPIQGNSGEYMCPYTSDGVVAEWVDKAINAKAGATIGKTAGAYAGQKAMEQIPFVGGILGGMAGEAIGRKIAIESCGGWEYIKDTSDLSFNSCDDLAVYIYATHSSHSHYDKVLSAAYEIYPDLEKNYWSAIKEAPRR